MQPENINKPCFGRRSWTGMVAGGLIALVGVMLLLQQTNLVDLRFLLRFWPAVLVIYGLLKLFQASSWSGRLWGVLLMIAGAVFQAGELHILQVSFWGLFWSLLLIGAGLTMISGTLEARGATSKRWWPPDTASPHLNEFAVFGGGERRFSGTDFEGGQLNAVFGGFKVDLTQASMKANEAEIEFNAVFGGGEIRVPENWNVVMRAMGIFGGYSDGTRHPKADDPASVKTLVIRGVALFGGVEVKN